jgi:hypothetical protein
MKRGIVVSDIHTGSIYGLQPPAFTDFAGRVVPQNVGQQFLWRCWLDFAQRAGRFKPDFVIVNGDVVDGPQRKNQGAELSLPAPGDQVSAAIEVLRELRKKTNQAKYFFTQGTPYHVGEWGDAEESIASALGATEYLSLGNGKLCREVLWLSMEGVILEAAHHISGGTGFYRLTSLDREAQWSALSGTDASKGIPKSDLLIRSHVHNFAYGEHASKQILTTPCWQLQTRYARKHSVHRLHPDIGGIMLEIDGEAKLKGEAPCIVRKELYTLPPVAITSL